MSLAENLVADSVDAAVQSACEFALSAQGIDDRDVLATLVFGSRAKGSSKSGSDVDLIFFIAEGASHPEFSYRRLYRGAEKIDFNVIKASFLNGLCQSDVGWSYRLHRARPVRELTRIPEALLSRWMTKIDSLVESAIACRYRLLRNIRECRSLLRGARQFERIEPGIAKYLMLEAVFLVPTIYLNYCRSVPFQNDIPWNEALRMADSAEAVMARHYKSLVAQVSELELFRGLARNGDFAREIKALRDECRTTIIRHSGNAFRDGYGMRLGKALDGNSEMRREILQLMGSRPEAHGPLIHSIWNWLNLAREPQRSSKLPTGARTAVRRKRSRTAGTRYIHYEQETSRLKAIIPTGGCRVPTCTFCMLPSLARTKSSVDEVVAAINAARRQGPVRQLTIYTDGSFFDHRELDQDERLLIARTARELGAKELLVESLPRFLNAGLVNDVVESLGPDCRLRLGVGVQSTDALVRQYVTRTPITQNELRTLLEWRKVAPFALRLYLLANKPMMSAVEDRLDLHRSLQFLNEWLTDEDTVTVNPLLPTNATVLERIWSAGFWRPLRVDEVAALQADLRSRNLAFRIEFGPASVSTCSDLDLGSARLEGAGNPGDKSGSEPFALTDAAFLPWSILGSLRHRSHWATRGGLQPG